MKEQIAGNCKDPLNLDKPTYLQCAEGVSEAKVTAVPSRDDIPVVVQEQMIVEYYSNL